MRDVTVVASFGSKHQTAHAEAMVQGLSAIGVETKVVHSNTHATTPIVICWGWRSGVVHHRAGRKVLVMERGYIGDRFKWTSLAWNGLNNRGTVPPVPEDGGERFHTHQEALKPWNPAGDYVLLIGQVPGDMSLQGRRLEPWYAEQTRTAAAAYGMPVMFRPHPLAARRGGTPNVPGAISLTGSLQAALAGAAVVVTYNSNAGVDALLAGKPVTVADEGSMAWNVAPSERDAWAHRLAWRQWSLDEIASGLALRHVWNGHD